MHVISIFVDVLFVMILFERFRVFHRVILYDLYFHVMIPYDLCVSSRDSVCLICVFHPVDFHDAGLKHE